LRENQVSKIVFEKNDMQILKRAKGDSGEIVSAFANEKSLRDEVNRRTAKAGYTTRYGEPTYRTKIMSAPPNKRYEENYVRIFGHE